MKALKINILILFVLVLFVQCSKTKDTFTPYTSEEEVPKNHDALWKDYDPRKEPLEVEILKAWEEDGVVIQVLRYRVGVFKGKKAMMAAVYGYPKGAKNAPGLIQVHGGGQRADYRHILSNAKNGYATISLAWAGRIRSSQYSAERENVKAFLDGMVEDSLYRVTTDWGAIDAYHAPSRYEGNNSWDTEPKFCTLDAVVSPRNSMWFMWTLGARRAITFLENQKEVDKDRIGIYGHSMGGQITVLTATDSRIKAAAPSCGGLSSNTYKGGDKIMACISDSAYLEEVECPIIFMNPVNDFNAHSGELPRAVNQVKGDWRIVSSAHHSHYDHGEYQVGSMLWFNHHLKETFSFPKTPETVLDLNTGNGIPHFVVKPDDSKKILEVDVFYTQDGQYFDTPDITERNHRKFRFWHYAKPVKNGKNWETDLPLLNTSKPLWAYAIVKYALEEPISGPGYSGDPYNVNTFHVASLMEQIPASKLMEEGVKATAKTTTVIEDFDADWQKEWYTKSQNYWGRKTHKLRNSKYKAPNKNVKMALKVQSDEPNNIKLAMDNFTAKVDLPGGANSQTHFLSLEEFKNKEGESPSSWDDVLVFSIDASNYRSWKGDPPVFKSLHWQ